jgi:hypothetical protein
MDTLFNYFTELNKSPKINEEINEMVEHEIANIKFTNTTTHILNDYITQDEIERCIKNLKNMINVVHMMELKMNISNPHD